MKMFSLKELANVLLLASQGRQTDTSGKKKLLNRITHMVLRFMAAQFNLRPSLRKYMQSRDGWINVGIGFKSRTGSVEQAIIFKNGRVRVFGAIPDGVDVTLIFMDDHVLKEMARSTPNEILNLILKNKLVLDGNLAALQLFNYYIALIMGGIHQKMIDRSNREDRAARKRQYSQDNPELSRALENRKRYRMPGVAGADKGVKYLDDPYLAGYSIEDFPRLKKFLDIHFEKLPEVCAERPRLITEWHRQHGFENDNDGRPWAPEKRQSLAFRHLMTHKEPVIRQDDLIAGTTTAKEVGVTVFPDGQGTMFWAELNSVEKRVMIPYVCTKETARTLHHDVFPYWLHRNLREYVRRHFDYPLCQKIDERFVAYFVWKSVGISHTIPNFKRLLEMGIDGVIRTIHERLANDSLTEDQTVTLNGMITCLESVVVYANRLSEKAALLAAKEKNTQRKKELQRLAKICSKVPTQPAETLDEALNAVWILWVALHMENSNTGLSLGRLDQLFQPFFENDIAACPAGEARQAYIRHAIELTGCFIMRLTDHVPLLPDIANYLFGGAASTQAVTLGGITPEGEDAVNDMTYIFLKVTEMLAVRDVNVNARFHKDKNSTHFLKRLCEVNIITAATPIMQSDTAVFKSLAQHGYPREAVNDWAATGCVEPTLQGRHFSHTGSILFNLVAPVEMALNNGTHPLMRWQVGPQTGSIEKGDFARFEDFFEAWKQQQGFMAKQAVELNNKFGEAHQQLRPTPLLSAMIDGTIDSAKGVLKGGAHYNSSGTSNIGLADVIDSLMVIKKLVFDEKAVSFKQLKQAVDTGFADAPALLAMIRNKVPQFGSGNTEALAMGNRVAKVIHDCFGKQTNYRGGHYTTGFWSMSQHVAYGSLSGTLPSGRLAGKAFTPGLTPNPMASRNFLDNIGAVANLDPENMDNNIAFNVKLSLDGRDSREKNVDNMLAYVKSYFEMGGMQMQFNVVTSEMLKDAMANPENYRNLMVRISGYNAYFVTLNRDIQVELIERTEYGV